MALWQAWQEGGWGMIPTLTFGVVMLAVAIKYAVNPEKRFVPLLAALGVLTLSAGTLGFVTGLIKSIRAMTDMNMPPVVTLIGAGEALNCVGLALMCVVAASVAASIGAFKLSQRVKASNES